LAVDGDVFLNSPCGVGGQLGLSGYPLRVLIKITLDPGVYSWVYALNGER